MQALARQMNASGRARRLLERTRAFLATTA